jgi:hypothetical protein
MSCLPLQGTGRMPVLPGAVDTEAFERRQEWFSSSVRCLEIMQNPQVGLRQ